MAVTPFIRVGNPPWDPPLPRCTSDASPSRLWLLNPRLSCRPMPGGQVFEDTWDFVNAGETESWRKFYNIIYYYAMWYSVPAKWCRNSSTVGGLIPCWSQCFFICSPATNPQDFGAFLPLSSPRFSWFGHGPAGTPKSSGASHAEATRNGTNQALDAVGLAVRRCGLEIKLKKAGYQIKNYKTGSKKHVDPCFDMLWLGDLNDDQSQSIWNFGLVDYCFDWMPLNTKIGSLFGSLCGTGNPWVLSHDLRISMCATVLRLALTILVLPKTLQLFFFSPPLSRTMQVMRNLKMRKQAMQTQTEWTIRAELHDGATPDFARSFS